MKLLEDYSFIYLPREGNAVANLLAKWRMAMTRYPRTNYTIPQLQKLYTHKGLALHVETRVLCIHNLFTQKHYQV